MNVLVATGSNGESHGDGDMSARVLVVELHPITRWGIARLIGEQEGLEVVGETSIAEAVRATADLIPDVVVVGLGHGADQGMPLAQELRDRFDDLGVVVLGTDDDAVLLQAFEAGVSAFVSRSAPVTELLAAVRHAAVAASSFTAAGLAAALRRQREAQAVTLDLSAREREVLALLLVGRSVPWIADDLHISMSTAKTYVGRLYDKLGVRTRAEVVMAAVRLGLVSEPAPAEPPLRQVIPQQRRPVAGRDLITGSR